MDLKQYFKKIKDVEESIKEPYPLVVSHETPDGGKAGTVVEVSRYEAAKAIVENRATLATDEQKVAYREQENARKKAVEKADLANRLQIAIVSDSDLRQIKINSQKDEELKDSR